MTNKRIIYPSYRFWVEIDGITEGAFSECAGLQTETEVLEWPEGGQNSFVHRLPGRVKFANLTLKRGVAGTEFWQWYHGNVRGSIQRRNLSIVMYGYADAPQVRWNVLHACPIKWQGPTLRADANETGVELIELVHQGFERA